MLRTRCSVEHAPIQQDFFHASGRSEMSWLHGDCRGLASLCIGHFQVITVNQTVLPLGVSSAFEGEGQF